MVMLLVSLFSQIFGSLSWKKLWQLISFKMTRGYQSNYFGIKLRILEQIKVYDKLFDWSLEQSYCCVSRKIWQFSCWFFFLFSVLQHRVWLWIVSIFQQDLLSSLWFELLAEYKSSSLRSEQEISRNILVDLLRLKKKYD